MNASDTPMTDALGYAGFSSRYFERHPNLKKALDLAFKLERQRNELLEALESLNLVIGLTPVMGNKDALQEACDIARAAIAKATGEVEP